MKLLCCVALVPNRRTRRQQHIANVKKPPLKIGHGPTTVTGPEQRSVSKTAKMSSQSGKQRSLIRDTCPTRFGQFSCMNSFSPYLTSSRMKWIWARTENATQSSCNGAGEDGTRYGGQH
uniref:Uncharacterized protein n=1 Tax=Anopheles albimanus TaxID=7167 RepID=A0A182FZF5_ANOAL